MFLLMAMSFGKNIRWLRKNINAEMIEGIDLLTNYAGFALAAEVKKGIALNLKTKDSFKKMGIRFRGRIWYQ
jgi:hypothetical protein